MPTQPSGPVPQPSTQPQPDEKRSRPVLGIAIGLGALVVVLIFSALIGGVLYYWFLRVPQATLAPQAPTQIEGQVTQAPQGEMLPTDSITQAPGETIPLPETAVPTAQAGTLPQPVPGVSYELLVIVKSLNVRTGPGTLYPVIITYPEGTRLLAVGRNEDASWFVIQITSTQQGWVSVPLVRYNFDRYVLPVFPAPPLEIDTPTPYGSAILVPPELRGSQPLAPILPAKRLVSLAAASLFTLLLAYLERMRLARLAKVSLRQVLVLGTHLFPH